jgi:flavin reductase (DIM6/NTAB) family NADH-FMN oxidoreductase RutF
MRPELELIADDTGQSASIGEFADAMGALASGVVLVTCWIGGRPWGMTVTAFTSVSTAPPTILVSVGSEAAATQGIAESGRFGVSILAAEQQSLARYGSTRGAAKFLEPFTRLGDGRGASPPVAGALAHLDCEVSQALAVADHTVLFGRVRAARASRRGTPLLYHDRRYQTLAGLRGGRPSTGRTLRCLST